MTTIKIKNINKLHDIYNTTIVFTTKSISVYVWQSREKMQFIFNIAKIINKMRNCVELLAL